MVKERVDTPGGEMGNPQRSSYSLGRHGERSTTKTLPVCTPKRVEVSDVQTGNAEDKDIVWPMRKRIADARNGAG